MFTNLMRKMWGKRWLFSRAALGSLFATWALVFKYSNECFVVETQLLRDVDNLRNTLSHNLFVDGEPLNTSDFVVILLGINILIYTLLIQHLWPSQCMNFTSGSVVIDMLSKRFFLVLKFFMVTDTG